MRFCRHFLNFNSFKPYVILLLLLGVVRPYISYSQNINLRFQHYTSDDGLSQNTVDCILKDSRGFMWFGTWNGLNRFDGYSFVVFKSDNTPNSLSNNFIYSICEDKQGDIWVGTKNGLNRFNHNKNTFSRFFYTQIGAESVLSGNISAVICDKEGVIWVGSKNGLASITIDRSNCDSIDIVDYTNKIPVNYRNISINALFEDRKGNIWAGTNNGLLRIDKSRSKFKSYINDPVNTNSLSYNIINSVFEDHFGLIWVGTLFGLNKIDLSSDKVERYYYNPDVSKSLLHFVINDIVEDNDGNLLIATLGGLNKYNYKTNNFDNYPFNQNDDYSMNNEFINSLFVDNQGNVWVGTDKGGVNKFSIYQKQFGYMAHDPANSNSISSNTINSLFDESGKLWIGTAGGGLNMYDKTTAKFTFFASNTHNSDGLQNDFITSISRDKSKNLWIGTWGGGLNKLVSTSGNGVFKKYLRSDNPNSISEVYVSSVWEDKRGFLVVGTLGGLDVFFPKKEEFKHIANNKRWKNNISEVGCILEDKKGLYWIGTRIGLFRIPSKILVKSIQDEDIERFIHVAGDTTSIPGNYIISLMEDNSGGIWVGTYGNGFCKIEESAEGKINFKNYTDKDGLANNVVYAMLEDKQHNLWLSTDNGLSRFDTKAKTFKNFFITDGLQSNQFYWSAACKSLDGRMYFGGIKGLNYFYPDSIKDYPFKPNVVITDFKIFNNSVNIGLWDNKKVVLDRSISELESLELSYKENVFSFEFSAMDYYLPEKIQYAYMMQGVDNSWVYVPSSRRFANYTNLKGGEYTFLVKAQNSDGIWNENPTSLKIIIKPPFWETAWFRIVGIIIITLSVILYFQYRTQKLKSRKRVLEKMVFERTEQIEKQKIQLEFQNKEISEQRDKLIELNKRVQLVNQLKLRFFTNISHEFRTPLTLILGPLEKLISSWKGDEITQQTLFIINRNAQRLLHLINQLMEFRKIETGKQDLKVSKGDICGFIENIYQSFEQLARQRNISYKFSKTEIIEDTWFDHDKIENIMFNLISNAFKYTPEKGSIEIILTKTDQIPAGTETGKRHSTQNLLLIKVIDTGIGIDKEHLNNIFKRFYRINTPGNLQIKGSGIGLSLTRELIRAHHGTILVESEMGKGTVFSIQIPYLKESFHKTEIVDISYGPKKNFGDQIDILSEEIRVANEIRPRPNVSDNKTDRAVILVVEDNYDLRTFLIHSLQGDYLVLEADNGKQGLEIAKSNMPDLIVSDIMMPEMDGLELCTRLKESIQTSHIPVILLTARSTVDNWIEGFETGADDYVAKPFNFEILKARIANLIESRRELKKLFAKNLNIEPSQITTSSADEEFIKKALIIVEENYNNPDFSVEKFIDKMAVSRSLLHKKLSALTDQSAGDFITTLRLKKSVQLLQSRNKNISEIAYLVGFNDPKYFSRIFKKHFGVSPTEYISD